MEDSEPADPPIVASDFFGGNIEGGIEKMRLRLLDLSNRNRLLKRRSGWRLRGRAA